MTEKQNQHSKSLSKSASSITQRIKVLRNQTELIAAVIVFLTLICVACLVLGLLADSFFSRNQQQVADQPTVTVEPTNIPEPTTPRPPTNTPETSPSPHPSPTNTRVVVSTLTPSPAIPTSTPTPSPLPPSAPASTVTIMIDVEFSLEVGQTALLESENLQIAFLEVTEDSRCPTRVQCFWQGQATIQLSISKGGQDLGNLSLTSQAGNDELATGVVDKYTIKLINVAPYPETPGQIDISDYVSTLVISES